MARRAEVNVDIRGDASDLTAAFDKVGASAADMADDVGKQAKRMSDDVDQGAGNIAGAIDSSEGKFRGFGDVVGGTGDIMEGFKTGNLAGVAMGFADLAGGITEFAVPALKAMRTAILSGLAPALTAISAHPLIAGILIGGAIIAGLILLEKKFGVVTGTVNILKDAMSGVLEAIGGVIRGFRDLWNNTIGGKGFTIGGVDLPGPFDIPSVDVRIPRLHSGGVVGGVPGSDQLRVLQAGETVLPRGQGGSGGGISIVVQGSVITERDLGRIVADALRQNRLIGVT
ncbi:MAG TPA: hypothetical protein VJQ57_04130 [Acidimicrobiia bacterium]|nr:hypothetical protein [Acidimicrobiia bacterium]